MTNETAVTNGCGYHCDRCDQTFHSLVTLAEHVCSKPQATPKTYRSSSGKEIPLHELADTYLVNIVRKMEKAMPDGGCPPLYPDLLLELRKRPQQTQDYYLERRASGK
jgi:hypothetical protein